MDGFLRGGQSLDVYTERVIHTAFVEISIAEKFARLLLNHPYVSFTVGMRNPKVNALFADVVSGRKSYPEIYDEIQTAILPPVSFRAVFSFRPALIGHRIHHRIR